MVVAILRSSLLFPPTTRLSRHLMTSKLRFLCDGTGDVYVKCYFSQLSSTYSTLLGPWKPYPGGIDQALRSLLDTSQQNEHRLTSTVQLLTKKRSIFLAITNPMRVFECVIMLSRCNSYDLTSEKVS